MNLTIATGNAHKTAEIRQMLGESFIIEDLSAYPELPEVEETGTTFLANATLKAEQISVAIPGLVLSDDSGLEVDALGGAPGVISARYAGPTATTPENNAKLVNELSALGTYDPAARFRCVMVIAEGGQTLASFDGTCEGEITTDDRGTEGFGYDPYFIPQGHSQTFAELGEQVKNQLSHRAQALQQALQWLNNHNAS